MPNDPPILSKADALAVRAGYWYDHAAGERVVAFFENCLRHGTGEWAGQPFKLLPWQRDQIIMPLFAWKAPDGRRRYNVGYISCAKKNGKTGLLSGLALYLMLADGEAGAEVYSAASDRYQAALIYREATKLIDASPGFSKRCRYLNSTKTITGPRGAIYRALSADARRQEGINASAILFDELHAQPNRELWDALRYAGSARRQPLVLAITTAGSDVESICGEQYQYAKRVLAGEIDDPSFFAAIFEASAADDWAKESTWYKANPSLGVTISLERFRTDFTEARETPAKEASFRRYRLNQWVQTADAWLSLDQWDACAIEVDPVALEGRSCYAGLDLSATDDTTALVLSFPHTDNPGFDILPVFYLPADNVKTLERKHRVPYRAWAKAGLINLTPGNVVDYQKIRAELSDLAKRYDIKRLAIDRKFQGQGLENDLIADGFDVMPAGQGWVSQDLPAKELERLLKAGWIHHGGHAVLRWHASNVVVDIDKAGNYAINKKRSRSKIDGIAATLMSLLCAMDAGAAGAPDAEPQIVVL